MKELSSLTKLAETLLKKKDKRTEKTIRRNAKINILLCGETDGEFSSLFSAVLKKSRARLNLISQGEELPYLPTVLVLIEKGKTAVDLSLGVTAGGARIRASFKDGEKKESCLALLNELALERSKYIKSRVFEEEGTLVSETAYYDKDRFESYLMEQNRVFIDTDATVRAEGAYFPFESDFNALTLFRDGYLGEVGRYESFGYDGRIAEGNEPEDRIMLVRVKADRADAQLIARLAYTFRKITEAI